MLGTIEAHEPDGTIIPVRGGRIRLLLGLLVADRMLARPLGHREFCRIAGGDDDPERARKTVNGAVMRLRETLGEEAITTDGETPSLNPGLVDVDLLDALRLMREAADAMRARLLARALSSVREALDIWSGAVPFPTLYQSFFEAAREDFESGIRSTTMTIARALLAEDDPAGAENLLRRAAEILPGDSEIAQLLIATLERSGRKADAERMRLAGEIDS
jgi:DNA-binding SARP family transcriptional activator